MVPIIIFVIKHTYFVSETGKVNGRMKCLISAHSSEKIWFLCTANIFMLEMFSG